MNTDYEVLNYLNLTNGRLGKLYKLTGYNPLPEDFVFNDETIKERLYINQMQNMFKLPEFIYLDKKIVKKHFKNSVKNIKKIEKIILTEKNKNKLSDFFANKLLTYFDIRVEITKLLLKEFKKFNFDEREACQEIFDLNPILGTFFEELFNDNFNAESLLENLEEKYQINYQEKLQLIEKKNTKKRKETETVLQNFVKDNMKEKSQTKNDISLKIEEKSNKNAKKYEKNISKIENTPKITRNKEK